MITQRNQILAAAGVVLVPVLVWAATRLGDPPPPAERPRAPAAAATALVRGPELPEDVRRLLAQERNWRAARRLRELTTPQSDPELLLVAAKAEAAWGGRELRVGGLTIHCAGPAVRCGMTTHAQDGLPKDPSILRTIVRQADQNLGAYASPVTTATVAVGDAVELR